MRPVKITVTALAIAFISFLMISENANSQQYEKEVQGMHNKGELAVNIQTPVEHKDIKRNGYSIHYFVSGDPNQELLIFLHPAFADHRCFDYQIDYFAKHYRIITVDMLGHGLSKIDKSKDKIDLTVDHLNSIMKLEGYAKAHFVGVSMGALIAQYYGLNNPERVLSMTIVGGHNINTNNREIAKAQRSENIKWIFKAIFSMNSFRRYVSSTTVSKPVEQARFYNMASLFTRKSFTAMSGLGNVMQERKNIDSRYPLLILSGKKDMDLVKRMSKEWHDSEPTSRYQLIGDAGHCANMDNPEEFNSTLMSFISGNE